jgi:hypothetical protein
LKEIFEISIVAMKLSLELPVLMFNLGQDSYDKS